MDPYHSREAAGQPVPPGPNTAVNKKFTALETVFQNVDGGNNDNNENNDNMTTITIMPT